MQVRQTRLVEVHDKTFLSVLLVRNYQLCTPTLVCSINRELDALNEIIAGSLTRDRNLLEMCQT